MQRCDWNYSGSIEQIYQDYHDYEWGKLNLNENYLFEMLILESFQSGLSWSTILHKRDNFKKAFADFDIDKVSQFDEQDIKRLLTDSTIIRNKLKINAAINNARVISSWHKKGKTLGEFLQQYIPEPIINHPQSMSDIPAKTDLSTQISKDMKKAGFKFVGPTTIYSFLQGTGFINDHLEKCDFKY
ncbi:DNA-3-methyladenine glycosylase I [Lactobacillus colini]|uniref:DNA-3-methyladenine glycosylase I n=1 Tax=Lactobacillus colini TaxID=1819254 RepID=A0ABS4MDI3_9LACO|nr:DNA-3-methyladenine glycosylase I [Lactobacillus colini]MBP2057742.1 DNA-3-methyladenine glycosylase I [Lactobacillus colini]